MPKRQVTAVSHLPEDELLQTLVEHILELFPETKLKSKKSEMLREILQRTYQGDYDKMQKTRQEISEREQLRREQAHQNESVTKRIAELEHKI